MKKKIIIFVFAVLILLTVIASIVSAVESYRYDMDPANGVDILEGFGAVLAFLVGGFMVCCELDLFFTVYYFFIKPKTMVKTILNIFANVSLLLIWFSDYITHFLYKYVAKFFRESIIVPLALFIVYIVLRIVYFVVAANKTNCEHREEI